MDQPQLSRKITRHVGSPGLDIIIGPMYSGKSSELLRRLSTVTEVGLRALYINHSCDTRNTESVFSTHNSQLRKKPDDSKIVMTNITQLEDISPSMLRECDIIGIDEAQFFESLDIVKQWINTQQKRVIIAGLDGDYKRRKFGKITDLIPECDSITKLTAYCTKCASSRSELQPAIFTHYIKVSLTSDIIDVGAHDKYEALCRDCHNVAKLIHDIPAI